MTAAEIDLIGYIAAACTTLCWLPQAVRTIRLKDTKALSLWTQSLFSIGIGLWLVYGIQVASLPIIIANALTLVLSLLIVAMKIRYG
jgi:MtN3 and saliva related transmembrane protein